MPRIDPIQLLNCLGVLLSPEGGIKSRDEVQRLAILMTKYSKKLVSKCIYIQILKCTETDLLGLFMGSEGWLLVHVWLTESIVTKNWPLVRELLELLLLCPVDIERLKTNNCPKLVKELSKDEDHLAIRALASKLVEQWLKTVKGEQVTPVRRCNLQQIINEAQPEPEASIKVERDDDHKDDKSDNVINKMVKEEKVKLENSDNADMEIPDRKIEANSETLPVLKISLKDGKQVVSQLDEEIENRVPESSPDSAKSKEKSKRSKDKEKSSSSSKSSSTSKHSSSKSHSSSEKHKSSSSRHNSSSSSNSSGKEKSRDKDKHKDKERDREKDKDRHASHSSKSKSDSSKKLNDKSSPSSKSKDDRSSKSSDRDKNKEKTKEGKDVTTKPTEKVEDKILSVHKLGKIPKLSESKKDKPSISIEVRKPDEPKPKTVKTFHSKFRKHGLEEEVKPPPSRAAVLTKKSTPPILPPMSIPKRPSPVHGDAPPEKKIKTIEPIEKPGSIKLIPAKPKPMLLLESDMFMDALNASATNKKDPKKRKRRSSVSKDGTSGNDGSPPHTPTAMTSPNSESKSVPPRFYQDTLESEDNKEKSEATKESNENQDEAVPETVVEKMETVEPHTLTVNGLKGVLCYHKRKGPKKSIKWKPDSELEEIQYFELDETERVNVTKTFTDMKHLERIHERDAFQKGRNISNDDVMEEKTNWRPLMLVDGGGQILVEHGKNSKEKDIQAIRQKATLQPLYFSKAMIPDSALEPDPETHPYSEPTTIPLEDVTGNQDNISDFRTMPWPEPKGNAPPPTANVNIPAMFPPNMNQFSNSFPNPQFPVVPPGFQPGAMVPPEWQNGVPPHMMPNLPGPMPPVAIPPGAMPPGMMMPPENMMMSPEMFGPNPMFPVPPEGFNMQQPMFPMDFNMPGPQGPPGPEGFPGSGNFRGPIRGRGASGHWRGKNANNWEGPPRGRGGGGRGGGGRKAVCIYFQRKGSCRQGDNCAFLHPGVNCPF